MKVFCLMVAGFFLIEVFEAAAYLFRNSYPRMRTRGSDVMVLGASMIMFLMAVLSLWRV